MRIERHFDVNRDRDAVVEVVCSETTLLALFPDAAAKIVAREGDRLTVQTHYQALGREGDASFHFTFLLDGDIAFEKVCDGHVWQRLDGRVSLEERGRGTRVTLALEGSTKRFVPELTVRGPMEEQLAQMAVALQERIESA